MVPYDAVHGYEDGNLHQHGQEAGQGVHPALPVEVRDRLLLLLAIVLVPGSDTVHVGLELLHGPHVFHLPYGEREQNGPHQDRKEYYAQPPRGAPRVERLEHIAYEPGQGTEDFA